MVLKIMFMMVKLLSMDKVEQVVVEVHQQVTQELPLQDLMEHQVRVVDQPTTELLQMVDLVTQDSSLVVEEVEHETVMVVTELSDKVDLDTTMVVVDQTQVNTKEKMVEVLTTMPQVVTEVT
tara:strand:- start:29 stop:394 length:366 start_codon:yes stop_codon:yes gene_type:complete